MTLGRFSPQEKNLFLARHLQCLHLVWALDEIFGIVSCFHGLYWLLGSENLLEMNSQGRSWVCKRRICILVGLGNHWRPWPVVWPSPLLKSSQDASACCCCGDTALEEVCGGCTYANFHAKVSFSGDSLRGWATLSCNSSKLGCIFFNPGRWLWGLTWGSLTEQAEHCCGNQVAVNPDSLSGSFKDCRQITSHSDLFFL